MEKTKRIDKGLKDLLNGIAKTKQFHIPTKLNNPKGLHQRFSIRKLVTVPNPDFSPTTKQSQVINNHDPYIIVEKPVDKNAEYFVLRLDTGGKDINHIKACRIGIHAYADAIQETIPELAHDLRERYPLIQ